jgi:hypothetical protein
MYGKCKLKAIWRALIRPAVRCVCAVLVVIVGWTHAVSAQPAPDFYAGKQITMIVGAGVGGAYDQMARVMARHLGRHIPGSPTIIVQNMPAAGSIAATNYLFGSAPKDGTVIAVIQRSMMLAKLTYPGGVRFELDKLNWIGSLNREIALTVAWHTAPHKTARDLFEKELIVGAIAGAEPETTPRLYNSLLGTKFKIVTGYTGTTELNLALERGEIQGRADWAFSSLKATRPDWLRDRKVTLLMQGAVGHEPELKDLPSALDFIRNEADRKVMELYFSQKTVARPVIAPPGIPLDRLALLRRAFMELAGDKEFLGEALRSNVEVGPISGEDVGRIVAQIAATPADIAERFAKAFAQAAQ